MSKEDLREALGDWVWNELSDKIIKWYEETSEGDMKGYNLYIDFIENDIYLLYQDDFPKSDDQGAFTYEDLVRFITKFEETYLKFRKDRDAR